MTPYLIVIKKKKIIQFFYFFILGAMFWVFWDTGVEVCRNMFGVKPGITLEGDPVAGLLPFELDDKIRQIAQLYERDPQNAAFFAETGEIIPARKGIRVDIRTTMKKLFAAQEGANLHLCVTEINPAITEDFFTPVFRGPKHKNQVSLVFNVDWGEECIPPLIDELENNRVKATFFITGTWAKKFPELVKKIAGHGHEVANHGYEHVHVNTRSRAEIKELIKSNESLIKKICGRVSPLFAPPYGEWNENVVSTAGNMGYRTIMWTIDTIDWQRPEPHIITRRVAAKLSKGSIILMHPTDPTIKALPEVIRRITERGMRCVTVSELLKE